VLKKLWSDVVQAAVHILNRISSTSLNSLTPKGLFDQLVDKLEDIKLPSIEHLRVYGCRVYVNTLKEKRVTSEKFLTRAQISKLISY